MRVRFAVVAVGLGWLGIATSALFAGVWADCNGNVVADSVDITEGTSADCNSNGIPDECELGASQCPDPTQCIFGGGIVDALGAAQLFLESLPDGNVLRVLGIGSSGEDGVRYGLQSGLTKELRFELPNLSAMDVGSSLYFEQQLQTETGDVVAGLSIVHEGNGLRFHGELASATATGFRLLVFQGNSLITDVAELLGGEFLTAPTDLASFACDLGCSIGLLDGVPCVPGEDCPAEACLPGLKIAGVFARQTLIALPQSGGVVGDRFVLQAQNVVSLSPGGAGLTLRAADTGPLGLLADDLVEVLPDCNQNGIIDACELDAGLSHDCDGNGVPDACDIAGGRLRDCDDNGTGDFCQIEAGVAEDCNGNGVPDGCDLTSGAVPDCNSNGIPDSCELAAGLLADCNENGVPDGCDVAAGAADCNGNGLPDACEVSPELDCDLSGVLDSCELALGAAADCNSNGVPDVCDLSNLDVMDCDQNGSPDSCDLASGAVADCNGNRVPDACDLASGAALDCNRNGVPDSCDLALLVSHDCNQNTVPDVCDIEGGTSSDNDGDGEPDECDAGEVPAAVAYEAALVSAQQLKANGLVPQETLDFLVARESDLSRKPDDLVEALRVVDFREAGTLELAGGGGGAVYDDMGDGGGASGGVVSGGTWLAISATGLVVGRMRVDMSWNNNFEFCSSVVGGHTFVGGVIGGSCQSAQIGALFSDTCVATRACGSLAVQCGTYQIQCQQAIGSITINFNTPLETICAACAEIPWQLPGDCNQDGGIDIGDASCLFGFLFLGNPDLLPCGAGSSSGAANKTLIDWNTDEIIDMSDGVAALTWLFNQSTSGGGLPHALGISCVIIENCPEACAR